MWLDAFFLFYRTLKNAGTALPQRAAINFVGATLEDDPANDQTTITVTGGDTVEMGGDVSGSSDVCVVNAIQTIPVSTTAPATNEVLKFDGSEWAPAVDESFTTPTGTGLLSATAGVLDGSTRLVTDSYVATGANIAITKLQPGSGYYLIATNSGGTAFEYSLITNNHIHVSAGIDVTKLAAGTANYVLTTNGSTNAFALISDANINSSAAIAITKLATGTAYYTLSMNAGGTSLAYGLLTNNHIDAAAAIAITKLATSTAFNVLVVNASGTANEFAKITNNHVDSSAAIAQTKLAQPTGTGFAHLTAGVMDAASKKVALGDTADVDGTLAIGNGGTGRTTNLLAAGLPVGHRLTLTSATPVTTGDVTGAGTIYLTQYTGALLSLYDGSDWVVRQFTEISLALSSLTSGKPYDVFCYDNSGTATLEFLVWTNDTTRATALAYQDGVLVKNGAATRRYMGTFYTTGTATTEDSAANRYLWNQYGRTQRPMKAIDTTASWNYTSQSWRQARAQTSNGVNYVTGDAATSAMARVMCPFSGNTVTQAMGVGVGVDSTSAPSGLYGECAFGSFAPLSTAFYEGFPGVGKHALNWLECGGSSGVFYGQVNSTSPSGGAQAGILATVWG